MNQQPTPTLDPTPDPTLDPTPDPTSNDVSNSGRRTNHRRAVLATALAAGAIVGAGVVGLGGSAASAIVDGEATTAASHPWQVALTDRSEQFCGGSLVSDRIVVTAAHCVEATAADEITVRAGVTDLRTDDGQERQVTGVIEQRRYATGVGDIAMLVLDQPFDASTAIAPIKLATAADVSSATTATVSGWGVTGEHAERSEPVLHSAEVPLVSDEECGLIESDNDDEMCAGGTGTDSCYGDSGGPLTVITDRGPVLAGVVSWGKECGGATPGVYAEVPTFAAWIAERVADPDAPVGDRLPTPEFDDGDFEDDFNESDDFGDEGLSLDIDAMTDDEFQEYIDGLSDAEFDAFLDEYDDETDPGVDDDLAAADDGLAAFDTNGDGIVQWDELDALFG